MNKLSHISLENQAKSLNSLNKTDLYLLNFLIVYIQRHSQCYISQQRMADFVKKDIRHVRRLLAKFKGMGLIEFQQRIVNGKWKTCLYTLSPEITNNRKHYSYWIPALYKFRLSRLVSRKFLPPQNTVQQQNVLREELKGNICINNTTTDVVSRTCVRAREGDEQAVVSVVEQVLLFRLNKTIGEGMKPFTTQQMKQLQEEFSFEVIQKGEDALRKAVFNGVVRDPFAYLWHSCKAIAAKLSFQQKGRTQLSPAARAMYPRQGQSVEPPKRETTFKRTAVEEEAMARLEKRRKEMYSKPNSSQDKAREELAAYKAAGMSDLDIFKRRISEAQERQRQKSLSHGMHEDFDNWHAQFPIPAIIEEQDGLREEYTGQASGVVFRRRMDEDRLQQRQPDVSTSHSSASSTIRKPGV